MTVKECHNATMARLGELMAALPADKTATCFVGLTGEYILMPECTDDELCPSKTIENWHILTAGDC